MDTETEEVGPISEIVFRAAHSGRQVHVRLWSPVFEKATNNYYCISELKGLEGGERKRNYSDTQFYALMMALVRFRIAFENQSEDFRFEGDSPHMFFPKEIPWVYGSDVYKRLCKMVDDEVEEIERERTYRREADEKK